MRNALIKAFSAGLIVGSICVATAAVARADGFLNEDETLFVQLYGADAVCATITDYRVAGVMGAAEVIIAEGFSPDSAADIINASVQAFCPENWALLNAIGSAARAQNDTIA